MSELHGLQLGAADIGATGAKLVAISVDSVEENRGVVERVGLSFPVLSDPDLVAVDAFGLRHPGGNPTAVPPANGDIPRPAVYVLENGVVRSRELTDNWRVRVTPERVLAALQ
jgi:peroxiredoxin